MLDNYNELREGMLAQCDKPAFPDQCLYTMTDAERAAQLEHLKEVRTTMENNIKGHMKEYSRKMKEHKSMMKEIHERHQKKMTDLNERHNSRHFRRAGAVTGGALGGFVANKLAKKATRNMKSAKAAKAVRATATLAGIAAGGYGGNELGHKLGKWVDK